MSLYSNEQIIKLRIERKQKEEEECKRKEHANRIYKKLVERFNEEVIMCKSLEKFEIESGTYGVLKDAFLEALCMLKNDLHEMGFYITGHNGENITITNVQ